MLALIAAVAKNNVIGNQGRIPWKIKGEQMRFKALTTDQIVIMGKRSFEEIGRPLPNRTTIVISNTAYYEGENCVTLGSLQEGLKYCKEHGELAGKDCFVAGGEKLYQEALPLADRLYITWIDKEFEGDTYFPGFKAGDYILLEEECFDVEIPYRYVTYERMKQ